MEGKHYDFKKTCVDKPTAEHVLNNVIKEYENNSNWKIGEKTIKELPSGEYEVFVELVFYENNNKMRM